MMKNIQSKRMYIIVALIIGAALAGTFMIDTNHVAADGGLAGSFENGMSNGNSESNGAVLPSILKMVSALVVVLFALYGSVYLLKKGMGRKFSRGNTSNALEVLESTFVAPRKTVSLLRVANRSILIGITDQQISVLTELNEEETAALRIPETEDATSVGFSEILATASKKVKDFRLYRGRRTAEA